MSNPFLVTGPALISFSGGRTSAYMLHEILRARGGTIPDDVKVAFANTGKEREETLRFVHECGSRWGVHVHWLEWRDAKPCFQEVSHNSAARSGEPFAALIAKKKYLPNSVTRFCTSELKIRAMRDFARAQGWKRWTNVIGLRYDEGHRVLKAIDRSESGKDPWKNAMPLSKAKVSRRDVMAFWASQPFDLALKPYEGNCDLCFLKGRGKLLALIRENPGMADWWVQQESQINPSKPSGAQFVTEYSYLDLERSVANQSNFFAILDDDFDHDAECGLICAEAA